VGTIFFSFLFFSFLFFSFLFFSFLLFCFVFFSFVLFSFVLFYIALFLSFLLACYRSRTDTLAMVHERFYTSCGATSRSTLLFHIGFCYFRSVYMDGWRPGKAGMIFDYGCASAKWLEGDTSEIRD
jgi:hypothetical protein